MELLERRRLEVEVLADRQSMGTAAAAYIARSIQHLLSQHDIINMVFAAAPSQDDVLKGLVGHPNMEWHRIRAFHLDEYIGLPVDSPQRFARYLDDHIFSQVPFKEVHYIEVGAALPPEKTCKRYTELLLAHPLHIACIGIGENGHIAFNDPSVANFQESHLVKVVKLEESCRKQQVNDGCFPSLEDVPTDAITLTIPAIMSAKKIVCVVPGIRKRDAVWKTLEGPVSTSCPASVLRRHPDGVVFLNQESASLISKGGNGCV